MRILVIDDEPLIARLVEITLSAADVEVTNAATAGMGVALALETCPDVILLDLNLPDGRGELVLEALDDHAADNGWRPRILIFSALDAGRVRGIAARYGVGWLPKPFELARLRALLAPACAAA